MIVDPLTADRDLPLHDIAASRRVEATALAALPPHALIERAGLAVARLARALWPHGRRAVVFAGPGNNGGDGLIAARWLHAWGWAVECHLLGTAAPRPGSDAAHALEAARATGLMVRGGLSASAGSPRADLVIDALLGLGANRAPEGEIAAAIDAINRADAPRLSIDLPSGLNADTGQPLGDTVVSADHTISLLTLKPGLFTGEGRALCGRIWFDNLEADNAGKGDDNVESETTEATAPSAVLIGPARVRAWQRRFARGASSHKGRHGDVIVLGGAPGMRGAAWLAATASLAAGAGRVYAALPDDGDTPIAARPELMRWDFDRWADASMWRDATVVCGCGGGTAIAPWLDAVLRDARRLVLDADALNLIAGDGPLSRRLASRQARGLATVLTPHPLEAARLLREAGGAATVQRDRFGAARTLAEKFRCTVVLKGSGSLIATATATAPSPVTTAVPTPPLLNGTGSGALATAGTGDVLAGWIGGLWAQSPALAAADVAAVGVAWHGWAAQEARGPLLAADLVEAMGRLHA